MLQALADTWYRPHPVSLLLAPLGAVWCAVVSLRRALYGAGWLHAGGPAVPVIVVGNVTVGGTGKTPLVLWLAAVLRERGFRPGILCNGFGAQRRPLLLDVAPHSDPRTAGDESVLLAMRSGCPVVATRVRSAGACHLVQAHRCDVVVCDDGLQHLALRREVELAVLDGGRRLGNGRCLPAGPLREPASRLSRVDIVVSNGHARAGEVPMVLVPGRARTLHGDERRPLSAFAGQRVHAVAGIGNPARFFDMLRAAGLLVNPHPFADHHPFVPGDLDFERGEPLLMTEKDAVKCRRFARPDWWYVPVDARLPGELEERVIALLRRAKDGQEAA